MATATPMRDDLDDDDELHALLAPSPRIRTAEELLRARPLTAPPDDRPHQFFTRWQAADDRIVVGWIEHFYRHRIPVTRRFREGCKLTCQRRHHHVFRWAMIYVHHVITPKNAKAQPRWCCEEEAP